MNIIIPIGGVGERFRKENYTQIKPLINFLGKPILFWLFDKLNFKNNHEIHIPYNHELDKFNFVDLITKSYPDLKINFYKIDFQTRGAAETTYSALSNFNDNQMDKKTIIIDSDNVYIDDVLKNFDDCENNCIFYFKDNTDSSMFSYIKIENGFVNDIEEKNKISINANCGVYGFRNAKILKESIEGIIKNNIKSKKEFYISNIYKYMLLNSNEKIEPIEINNFFSLGTPEILKINSFKFGSIQEKKRFCFDLDNTLVSYPKVKGDYSTVTPLNKNISFLNFLKSLGHEIIIYTARRMKTHAGSVGKVYSDIGSVTFETLKKFNIKYDEIYFGKPYADFYIDDCAVNSFDDIEKFTGFYNLNIEPRDSNSIEYYEKSVIKKSNDLKGIVFYYDNMPEVLKKFHPKIINFGDGFIEMERVNGITLSQVFVNNCFIKHYIDKVFEYFSVVHSINDDKNNCDIYKNYFKKTKERIDLYNKNFEDSSYNHICLEVLDFLENYEKENFGIKGVIHGDPVFTNIILDEIGDLKLIDMRGKIGDELSIYGDIFYDYAKVYQSIVGYDEILNEKFAGKEYKEKIKIYFENKFVEKFGDKNLINLKMITKSLILSLLYIHNNDKCKEYFNLIKKI